MYVIRFLRPVIHYAYHNTGHTIDVFKRARELADAENISKEDTEDLLIASLFHDTGFIESYGGNEEIGVRIAREWLTTQDYPKFRIARIEDLILATIPFTPAHNILEKIIQDADLDNFGRTDCFSKMSKVEEELRKMTPLDTSAIYGIFWKLHHNYKFQTPTSIRERGEQKLKNIVAFDKIYNDMMDRSWKKEEPRYRYEVSQDEVSQ